MTDAVVPSNLIKASPKGLRRFVFVTSAGVERQNALPWLILNAFGEGGLTSRHVAHTPSPPSHPPHPAMHACMHTLLHPAMPCHPGGAQREPHAPPDLTPPTVPSFMLIPPPST